MSLEDQVAKLIPQIESLLARMERVDIIGAASPLHTDAAPVYDLPPLTPHSPGFRADGSWLKDGSRWTVSKGGFVAAGTPVPECFGYISPTKTPHIWSHAAHLLDAETFQRWDTAWHANPFGVYRTDLESMLREGKTEVNFMLFNYMTQPFTTVVQ